MVDVTFLTAAGMRRLNRRCLGRDETTDVIAFGLDHAGVSVGDVYVCPAVARREARAAGITAREEELRLIVHGTLHVLGYAHPEGQHRMRSRMWRKQEAYLRTLMRGAAR